jgi:hypothetical protein
MHIMYNTKVRSVPNGIILLREESTPSMKKGLRSIVSSKKFAGENGEFGNSVRDTT